MMDSVLIRRNTGLRDLKKSADTKALVSAPVMLLIVLNDEMRVMEMPSSDFS